MTSLEGLAGDVNELRKRLDRAIKDLDGRFRESANLDDRIRGADGRIAGLERDMEGIGGKQIKLEQRLDRITGVLDGLIQKLRK